MTGSRQIEDAAIHKLWYASPNHHYFGAVAKLDADDRIRHSRDHDAQPAGSLDSDTVKQLQPSGIAIDFVGYLSDDSDSDEGTHKRLPAVPPPKRRKLDFLSRTQRKLDNERREDERRTALEAIEKLLQSKKTTFISGPSGLQAKRARTVQSHLALTVKRGHSSIVASECAAESH
ncbi:hypothetical protein AZE42_08246 [Rhizopogon vesiculosus]|uniref:Uncharacterized protein n=1 Tax=Rhizopogon vesiculosus TaxID=180088 RepID=A0A1J8R0U3_9AGAM|nr:hypothetical protein AZE42_08246 [Rhizopogon vesiculosus]